jgi:uncharacterized membrane protein
MDAWGGNRMNKKTLTLMAMIASIYLMLGYTFQSIAFGQVQVRIADALYPLISLGTPFLLGAFLGHFIFNLYGFATGIALGIGDLLSPFVLLIPKILIWKFGKSKTGLTITTITHVTSVALWVSYLLYIMFGLPMIVSAPLIFTGEFIAEVILGIPLTLAIKKRWSE